ncbi:hypothetical protein PIB30_113527, partial [Stylosanthes scabra]|nr:hypothetical protein [Stylosanthes scabra]
SPRICVGLADLQGCFCLLPRIYVDFHAYAWVWKNLEMELAMHMLAVLRICVALEWASKDGVTFELFQT